MLTRHIKGTLKNYLAILIVSETTSARIHIDIKLVGSVFCSRHFKTARIIELFLSLFCFSKREYFVLELESIRLKIFRYNRPFLSAEGIQLAYLCVFVR